MARYTVRRSYVDVIGQIWQPGFTCAQRVTVDPRDVDNLKDAEGHITRESVDQWLTMHTRDFRTLDDFRASIEVGEETLELDWEDENSEPTYNDYMYPEDREENEASS